MVSFNRSRKCSLEKTAIGRKEFLFIARKEKNMRFKKIFACVIFSFTALTSIIATAWSILEERANTVLIRCSDGSNSILASNNGMWTVVAAGNRGATGGQYAIVGQAALRGCGE